MCIRDSGSTDRHGDHAGAARARRCYFASCSAADHWDLAGHLVDAGKQLGEVIGLGREND